MADVSSLQGVKLKKEYLQIAEQDASIGLASDELCSHGEYMLKLITMGKANIHQTSLELRDNEAFMAEALKGDMLGFKYASDRLKEGGSFAFKAIELCEYAIEHVSPYHPQYDDLVVEALMINADMLELLSDERRDDFDTVLVAVRRDGMAIRFAGDEMRDNDILAMEAVSSHGHAIYALSDRLQAMPEIQEASRLSIEAMHREFGNHGNVVEFGGLSHD